jgi:hypothetical protein
MISFNSPYFGLLNQDNPTNSEMQKTTIDLSTHQQWNRGWGWKNVLNNLRLIIQPTILLWLIFPWLDIFPNRYLLLGFHDLIHAMNQFQPDLANG